MLQFNRIFFCDLWQLTKLYWLSEDKWKAIRLLTLSLLATFVGVRASIALNLFNKEFYNALQNFNQAAAMTAFLHFWIIVTILILAEGYAFYLISSLNIRWRRWLTSDYLKRWLNQHAHYRMRYSGSFIDNPDQRISEDIQKFSETTLSLCMAIFASVLSLCSFSYVLWGLPGNLTIPIRHGHALTIPHYLLWGALLYALLGTWLTKWIGRKLVPLSYEQQQVNADFRFSLIRLRESSEAIALYRGEPDEANRLNTLFGRVFNNFTRTVTIRKNLIFFTTGHEALAIIAGIFLGVPVYFQHKMQFGDLMQISGAFVAIVSAASVLIQQFSVLAEWRSVVARLTEFDQTMSKASQVSSKIIIREHDSDAMLVKNLSLSLPDGKVLLSPINLTLCPGSRILIQGHSGLGKSTLFRALAGIWTFGEGTVFFPEHAKKLFLPQKPYLPSSSLKEVLLYPMDKASYEINEQDLQQALALAELTTYQKRLHETRNWTQELSPGEQQLIGFARVFLNKPSIIFLDESTSALDEKTERRIYENLCLFLPDAILVSIGHRNSLLNFHQKRLVLSEQNLMGKTPLKYPRQEREFLAGHKLRRLGDEKEKI